MIWSFQYLTRGHPTRAASLCWGHRHHRTCRGCGIVEAGTRNGLFRAARHIAAPPCPMVPVCALARRPFRPRWRVTAFPAKGSTPSCRALLRLTVHPPVHMPSTTRPIPTLLLPDGNPASARWFCCQRCVCRNRCWRFSRPSWPSSTSLPLRI